MTGPTPDVTPSELAQGLLAAADILQTRADQLPTPTDGRALLDRQVLLQAAAGLPATPRFDQPAWQEAWRASRRDGTRPHRKALYEQMCQTLAAELADDLGRWENRYQPATVRRIASRVRCATDVGEILRRLAPDATSVLIDIHRGLAHIVAVYAGDTEIDTADDGDVFDTETLGAADARLQEAVDAATPAQLAAAPGWQHTPDSDSAHAYTITLTPQVTR
ncbi:hypothetical protein ABZ499_32815 [Streptomyces sp. NPDC019990]|uniref:hypothetical protein n=1 Tax=Streptomyces sp. NPDC019990 TaxID=3154693 RepID=UPI0033D5CEEC